MRALKTFTVRPRLPEAIAALHGLALNLRWSWDDRTQNLFRWIDPDAWEATGHDPVAVLNTASRARLESLASEQAFLSFLREVDDDLRRELSTEHWFQRRESPLRSVAYFSPEFGLAAALPQYSGGLGVLAGDHLKAATGLGVPLVGVGLFYQQGYFRQELTPDGWQQERYVALDPHAMALNPEAIAVQVDLVEAGPLVAHVWRADVGRVPLYLLDSDIEENQDEGRRITDRLYGGDVEHRLRQEILLGIGGVRALYQLGHDPQVFHTNEGHAGFLGLERISRCMHQDGLSFAEAKEAVRSATVFTTHTPVSAGIDRFPRALMERYFGPWAKSHDVSFNELMALGHAPDDPADAPFNMAMMGFRLAGWSNGVSKLHGVVSRKIFAGLWPGIPENDLPITSVTNGVHSHTWVSPEMNDLFDRHVLPEWQEAAPDRWGRIDRATDGELWQARERARERLVTFVRRRLKDSALAKGLSEADVAWAEEVFDPGYLTIGFARRFAAYKRATLLLSQPDRLAALLLSTDRPVQLVFAGKAHPADDTGKEMIRQIVQFSRRPELQQRFAFIEDYDIDVARTLYQGCDVWLNTPRRPLEACGTSGEKAALNGALNCSVLDGWWDELFDGENGWAILSAESQPDLGLRDHLEANSLFDLLEHQVVPLFYDRKPGRPPAGWLTRVRASLRSLGPVVPASRMVREYVERLYEPAARRGDALSADGHAGARSLAAWKARVSEGWSDVRAGLVDGDGAVTDLGSDRTVRAEVDLGRLSPDDVSVQLVHGSVGLTDELAPAGVVDMARVSGEHSNRFEYEGSFTCERAGKYGFIVRVVPSHPDLVGLAELGRVTWAS
ncbi:MAG: alpha-glucan family phosphorylase [Acidimicrobiales bacterium]